LGGFLKSPSSPPLKKREVQGGFLKIPGAVEVGGLGVVDDGGFQKITFITVGIL